MRTLKIDTRFGTQDNTTLPPPSTSSVSIDTLVIFFRHENYPLHLFFSNAISFYPYFLSSP